jgi:hypothetical protein
MDMYGNIWIHLKMGIGCIENGSMDTPKKQVQGFIKWA